MRSTQLRFWPDPQPIVERLGRDFFRQLPEAPGVYLMYDAADVVVYVGKARSLRHRLASYRVANPDRLPRRLLRLLHRVERIRWELCDSEQAALQREAELLLSLRPRFNRAGVWPRPVRFLAWQALPHGIELAATEHPEPDWQRIGLSGAQTTLVHRALVRLLWRQLQPVRSLAGLPAGWFDGAHGTHVFIRADTGASPDAAAELLALLARGEHAEAERRLHPARTPFERSVVAEDWATVSTHFAGRGVRVDSASPTRSS